MMRVLVLSDIHVDYPVNLEWVEALSAWDFKKDCLILAGDVTHVMGRLENALRILRSKFRHVFFVPGNHELWVMKREAGDSIDKFEQVRALCRDLGVIDYPEKVGEGNDAVWIVPLFSWYVIPEEGEASLFIPKSADDPGLQVWSDAYFVKWPAFSGGVNASEFFLEMNQPRVNRDYDAPVISFSHFLSRQDLLFRHGTDLEEVKQRALNLPKVGPNGEKRSNFNFSRVAGSKHLDQQIRQLGSVIHAHGHQHRNRFRKVDDIWYVSHCLGYKHEREKGQISHLHEDPLLIWENGKPASAGIEAY